jgi:hypothetical protein
MSPRANVRSVEAVRQFRPALIRFEEDLSLALGAMRQEINRTLDWLDHDCAHHWQQQVRLSFDRVAESRTQLSRRQMITVAGRHPDCLEEKKALAAAKRQLEYAQDKVRMVREWSIKAHRAADEYSSRAGQAEQTIGQSLSRSMALMDRMIAALESYVGIEGSLSAGTPSAADSPEAQPSADGASADGASADGPSENANVPGASSGEPSAAPGAAT